MTDNHGSQLSVSIHFFQIFLWMNCRLLCLSLCIPLSCLFTFRSTDSFPFCSYTIYCEQVLLLTPLIINSATSISLKFFVATATTRHELSSSSILDALFNSLCKLLRSSMSFCSFSIKSSSLSSSNFAAA